MENDPIERWTKESAGSYISNLKRAVRYLQLDDPLFNLDEKLEDERHAEEFVRWVAPKNFNAPNSLGNIRSALSAYIEFRTGVWITIGE